MENPAAGETTMHNGNGNLIARMLKMAESADKGGDWRDLVLRLGKNRKDLGLLERNEALL